MRAFAVVTAVLVVACVTELPPSPPPYQPSDRDAPDTPLGGACLRLRRLGCPEGFANRRGRTCFETMSSAAALVPVPDVCLRAATTIDDVRACGDAQSIRVRCIMPTVDDAGSTLGDR